MAERPPARTPEDSHAEPKANGADHVPLPRLAADPDFFLDQEPEATDDSPTIISKNPPAAPATTAIAPEAFNNSLRGRTLAHFELIEPIGVGGMAAVIRARDKQLDRIVALKILPPETAADPENVRRFHHEARAAAKLDHENIARVFFYGEDQRLHFIAFEFVEGINLRTLLERRGRLPVAEAVHYMLQIASGLAHAAGRGVVHRDIKPSNIIISPNGRAKLVDMGLARSLERRDDQALTQSGMTLGTFDYISPEQALEPRDADVRSDIYSLGCTFYHMLTGNPPVPEGTAARKLHHHQHVPPIDPRQLNSDIPDDVAALLARMMAKDPKDRYQRPEHLVQHLIQIAQKVGAAAEIPDGVLFVDAPLPNPPQKRPLLMAALAAGVLALILGALALAPPRSPSVVALVKPGSVDLRQGQPVPVESPRHPVTVSETPRAHPDTRAANDEEDLRKLFAASHDSRPVVVDKPIDLMGQGVVFHGKALTVQAGNPERDATLRLKYLPGTERSDPCVGIVVAGGTVVFKNLRFEIDAGKASQLGLVAAVVVKKDGSAVFEKCTFVQKAPVGRFLSEEAKTLIPVASVAVEGGDGAGSPRMVTFKECYFQEGQDAIAVDGQADIRPTDCAFGKHNALFHLRADRKGPLADLRLARCSAFVVGGPAFRLDGEAQCRLTITDSIFSVPENAGATSQHDEQHLIHQTGAMTPAVQYDGKRNCFHNLNALWGALPKLDGSELIITDWDIFVAKTGKDVASTLLNPKVNPWNTADPLKVQVKDPKAAFRVNPDLREVRTVNALSALGIHQCTWGKEYAEKLPVLPAPRPVETLVLRPNQKVVDPSALMSKDQVYPTLAGALEDAVSKDEILIKEGPNNRLVEVKPLRLNPDLKLTFKPYEGHHPILTLAATADEEDVALFRLGSGQLRFEQLEFLLRPDKKRAFKAQSVVAMKGTGQCVFNQCAFTLAGEDPAVASVRLSIVTLLDPREAMKMLPARDPPTPPMPPAPPDIQLDNCFLRGKGECLSVRASRPFALGLENCLAVLAGSMVSVDGSSTEAAAPVPARVKLERVTTYLTDHLVQLRAAGNGKGLVPTLVTARNCLFAAAGNKSFIHLFGPDSEKQMKELFGWDPLGQHNAYAGFDKMLDQQATGEMMVMLRYDQDNWVRFANESVQPLFVRGKCFELAADRPLAQAMPGDFRTKTDLQAQLMTYGSTLWRDGLPCLAGSDPGKPAPSPEE